MTQRKDGAGRELRETVARELRPAALLWMTHWVAAGVWAHIVARVLAIATPLYWNGWYIVSAVITGIFVFPDAEARRVFARPRKSAVEMVMLLGAVAWMIDYQWVAWLFPQTTYDLYQEASGATSLPVVLFWMALMPALFEEWMYRGLLLSRFRRVLPDSWAIAAQAMLFSLMHFDHDMLLPHFVFGCVAGVLRIVAGGLWPCMLWHFAWNAACTAWPGGFF